MNEFDDSSRWQSAIRLSDLYETARRLRRLGIREVYVEPHELGVSFLDQRFGLRVSLTIEPWRGEPGWYWYADASTPDGFGMGPLLGRRLILWCPYPRQVVRAYQGFIRWERRTPRRKLHRT